ncbi:hypothetical protein, partial [Stutzerimonas balearica]|uniref:hypothetical protein n=1 Tax=Stutzerimonas balearica TaxID=74829 RepID=UPI002899A25C
LRIIYIMLNHVFAWLSLRMATATKAHLPFSGPIGLSSVFGRYAAPRLVRCLLSLYIRITRI